MKEIQQDNNGNSKYYTPTIDEFHVGFEYEEKSAPDWLWESKVFKGDTLHIFFSISRGVFRVKQLDREDIENSGFLRFHNNYTRKGEYKLVVSDSGDEGLYYEIKVGYRDKWYIVKYDWEKATGCDPVTLFIGDIKNKSELKKLMKQLHIPITTKDK